MADNTIGRTGGTLQKVEILLFSYRYIDIFECMNIIKVETEMNVR